MARKENEQNTDWITNEIRENNAQRDHFKTLHDEERYCVARNHCVNLVRNAKITYYKACVESNKGDSKNAVAIFERFGSKREQDIAIKLNSW